MKTTQANSVRTVKKSIGRRAADLWHYFTTYEKIWFFSILILSVIFAFLFPEEDVNGVNGRLIMGLYLADTFLYIFFQAKQMELYRVGFCRNYGNCHLSGVVVSVCHHGIHTVLLAAD